MRWLRPLAVVAATAAWVIGTFAGDLDGWPFGLTVAGGGVLTAVAVGLPLLAEHRTRRRALTAERIAEDAAARMQLVLDDALEPLAYLVGRITDEPDDATLRGQAVAVVLSAAPEVLEAPRLRACWFALDEGPPARLVNAGFRGRAEPPRTVFRAGTPLGDVALRLLAERTDLFCRDARADPPPGWDPADHDYRTFIVVPVATEARAFGILTIDGLAPGDLSGADVAAVRVFARLLAVALGTPRVDAQWEYRVSVDTRNGGSDAAQRARLARILSDPAGYFAQARRSAHDAARREISARLRTARAAAR